MLTWFAPKCPLDTADKAWTERRMRWLADQFGIQRMRQATVFLPISDFFAGDVPSDEAEQVLKAHFADRDVDFKRQLRDITRSNEKKDEKKRTRT